MSSINRRLPKVAAYGFRAEAFVGDWTAVRGATVLTFIIEPTPEGSLLRFDHSRWRDVTDFCASCNSMWGNLMFRLKRYAESGKSGPQWTE